MGDIGLVGILARELEGEEGRDEKEEGSHGDKGMWHGWDRV